MLYIGLLQDAKEKKIGEAVSDYISAHYLVIEKRSLIKRNTGCLGKNFSKVADIWGGGMRTQLFFCFLGVEEKERVNLPPSHPTVLAYYTPGVNLFFRNYTPRNKSLGMERRQEWKKQVRISTSAAWQSQSLCAELSSGSQLQCFPLMLPPPLSYTEGKKQQIFICMSVISCYHTEIHISMSVAESGGALASFQMSMQTITAPFQDLLKQVNIWSTITYSLLNQQFMQFYRDKASFKLRIDTAKLKGLGSASTQG